MIVQQALDKIIEEGDDTAPKPTTIGKNSIDIVIEELQKKPEDREYVNCCLPQYKLDPAWIEPPCYAGDEGQRFDWQHICRHYVYTLIENPKLGVADKGTLEYRFDCYMQQMKKAYCDGIKQTIKYDQAYIPQANRFLEEIYNIYKPSFVEYNGVQYYNGELFKAVIKHFIWSIKWKMNKGTMCLQNLFINLEGEQGCGKSQFSEHLGKAVLGNYFTTGDIDMLGDQFGAAILEDKFLINFDELVRNDVPVEKIKQITTAEKTTNRKMMAEKYINHYIRASFMSTCNKPIYEVINDETGNRRFANFKFMNGCIKDEVELCAKLDKLWADNIVALWKSVDENLPNGYVVGNDMGVLLDRARTTYNAKGDTVRRWLRSTSKCIVSFHTSGSQKLELAYNDYKEYCSIEDQTPCSFDNFKGRVKNMYTGKVKLPPNKLAIASISEASANEEIDQTEVNPFTDYIQFVPYKFDDEQNVPDVPDVPPSEVVLEEKNKICSKTEKPTGTTGTCGTFGTFGTNNSLSSFIKNQNRLSNDWNTGKISHEIEYEDDGGEYGDEFINKMAQE